MGTNYYADIEPCDHCKRPHSKMHIGKRSGGWEFHFQAYDRWDLEDMIPEFMRDVDTLFSWKDWKKLLSKATDVKIYDNEGNSYTFYEFKKIVEDSKKPFKNSVTKETITPQNHHKYCMKNYGNGMRSFNDSDGWSFSTGDFS